MDFVHFLSSHMLDPTMGGKRLYRNVVAQAVHAEALGIVRGAMPSADKLEALLARAPARPAFVVPAFAW